VQTMSKNLFRRQMINLLIKRFEDSLYGVEKIHRDFKQSMNMVPLLVP